MPQYVPPFDSPPSITNRLVSNSRAPGTTDHSPGIRFLSTKNNRICDRGRGEGRGVARNRTPGVAAGLSPLSPCFLTVHTVLIGDHERCAFRQPIWWLRAPRTKFFRWIDLKSVINSHEFTLRIAVLRLINLRQPPQAKNWKLCTCALVF